MLGNEFSYFERYEGFSAYILVFFTVSCFTVNVLSASIAKKTINTVYIFISSDAVLPFLKFGDDKGLSWLSWYKTVLKLYLIDSILYHFVL